MSVDTDIAALKAKLRLRTAETIAGVEREAFTSIVDGSPITGAPGQPIDEGDLKGSWKIERQGPGVAFIFSGLWYAGFIEDGLLLSGKRLTLRSAQGGAHSVALTRQNFSLLVEHVVRDVVARTRGA